jgi:Transposase
VHDKFHVAKHLNEAVDQVRRAENRQLHSQGNDLLSATKYVWLKNPDNWHEAVDEKVEKRILAQLAQRPPPGFARWNGRLLAEALGDVSDDAVWRVMRKHDLHLDRHCPINLPWHQYWSSFTAMMSGDLAQGR